MALTVLFVVFVAYESLLQWAVKFGACLHQSSAILVDSQGISFSMLARWGSVEASRGGMLEVIGAVGSMLKALLLLFYFFAAMFVHLAVFLCRLTWAGSLFASCAYNIVKTRQT